MSETGVHSSSPLLTVDELLATPPPRATRFIEVSTDPAHTARIRGAFVTGLDTFVGEEGPRTGRQPLPPHDRLVSTLRRERIFPDTRVIITLRAPADLHIAARAWVTLRWAGVADVAVLDPHRVERVSTRAEELANWAASESRRDTTEWRGRFSIDASVIATEPDIAGLDSHTVLVDARSPEAFGGAEAHIPGARNLPAERLLTETGFHPLAAVRELFREQLGVDPTQQPLVLSCGSGISASVQALALAQVGIRCPVYIGSWSEWRKLHPAH